MQQRPVARPPAEAATTANPAQPVTSTHFNRTPPNQSHSSDTALHTGQEVDTRNKSHATAQIQAQLRQALPFLYDICVLPAALPGLLFMFTMAGELLLAICTVGALLVYLAISGGAEQNAVITYVCFFVAVQMAVLYSCLPLVWISLFNIPLLMLVNMLVILTGGWGLIHFPFFIRTQPIMAQTIEMGLFSLLPVASLGFATWLVAYLTSVRFAVYVAIIYGFLLLRIFLKSTTSSFHKLLPVSPASNLILGNAESAAILIVYLIFPSLVFLINQTIGFIYGITPAFAELVLVAILPFFLATFIQLRGIYEHFNITVSLVSNVRVALGLTSLFLACWVAQQSGISAAAWLLFPVVLCYTSLGFSLSKGNKFWFPTTILAMCTLLISAYSVFSVIPVSLHLQNVSPYTLTLVLLINAVITLVTVVLAATGKRFSRYLSPCLMMRSVLLVHSECFLMSKGVYLPSLAGLTTLIEIYMLSRLQTVSKVTRQCQWFSCSVHAMKLPFCLLAVLRLSTAVPLKFLAGYSSAAVVLIMVKVLFLEERHELSSSSAASYLACVAGGLLVFFLNVVQPILHHLHLHVSLFTLVLTDLLVSSAVSCKLTLRNMKQYPKGFRVSGVLVVSSGLSLVVRAPIVSELISPWLLGMLEVAVMLYLMSSVVMVTPPQPRLFALLGGILLGIPTGVTVTRLLYPSSSPLFTCLSTSVFVEVIVLLLLLWRYSIGWKTRNLVQCAKDGLLHGTLGCLVTSAMLVFTRDVASLMKVSRVWDAVFMAPSTPMISLILGIASISIRFFCLQWQQQDPFNYQPGLLPTYSNILTLATYFFTVLSSPIPFPEIWNSASSIVLLCLQQDRWLFQNFRAAMRTSTIFAVCATQLVIFSYKYSLLYTKGFGLFAGLEMVALPLGLPPLYIMAQFLSHHPKFKLNEDVVILSTPLPVVIWIFGNSYASWLLAGTSFAAGIWLLQETSFGFQTTT